MRLVWNKQTMDERECKKFYTRDLNCPIMVYPHGRKWEE